MARVLVVATDFAARRTIDAALTPLQTLGIEAVPARVSGNTLALVGRTFPDAGAQEVRDYLNANFDAVLIVDRNPISNTNANFTKPINVWTTWNAPTDKPVAFFGPNLSAAITGYNLPADFPIIRPDPTDLSNTTHLVDANTFVVPSGLPLPVYSRLGTRVRLNREQVSVYTPAVCAFEGSDAYFWKLDTTQHTALGANGEILAVPDFPDRTYPADAVMAYRYKNRYFFPLIWEHASTLRGDTTGNTSISLFWLVYALKCMGIQPSRQAILCIEFDHPIVTRSGRADGLTAAQQYTILRRTYEWLADFCKQTGLVIPCGVENGSWVGRQAGYHWDYVQNPAGRAIHDLLIRESAVFPCGVHDHSYTWGGQGSGPFRRAGNNAHRFAAPNDVPVEYGQSGQGWVLVNPKVAAEALRTDPSLPRTLDGFINIGAQTSGTDTLTTSVTNLCEYTAQMVLADEFAEMQALGFADGYCGRQRYTNCAGNQTGGEGYWKALIAFGFRGVRRSITGGQIANDGNPDPSRWQVHPGLGRQSRYRGLHFVHSTQIDWNASTVSDGSYGLYRSDRVDSTVVGYWKLDTGTEFTATTWNDAAVRWKAYRRAMGLMVGIWLGLALYWRGTVYQHPPSWFGADPANPTDVVDTGSDLKVNAIVEILKAMRAVQQVLSDYLRFGSPSDVMDLRETVGA
jgi:hypothetical protein